MAVLPRKYGLVFLGTAILAVGLANADDRGPLVEANRFLQTGRYAEAEEAFSALPDSENRAAILGKVRCKLARGKTAEADQLLKEAAEADSQTADFIAIRASLAFQSGDYKAAKLYVGDALSTDKSQLRARWIAAELHRRSGRIDDAQREYSWFIDHYNENEDFSPDDLVFIGRAAAMYARWKRNSGQFRFLVNSLFPSALELDPNFWQAHVESARLFLEKYNESDAKAELDKALAINANAAEVYQLRAELALQNFDLHAAKAAIDRALEINPNSVATLCSKADWQMANLRPTDAIATLEKAKAINPLDEAVLGRLAAACGAVDGMQAPAADHRMDKIAAEVTARNSHCGDFFMAMGDSFDRMRRYPAAAKSYEQAQQRMLLQLYVRGRLGLVLMRLGQEARAAELLEESFDMDPFNVRVKNTLEVLEVLQGYAVLETDHFVIRFDRGQDEILARYAARYLEDDVYPEIVESLGYAPPEKTLFEIFNKAKNHSGHSWFSARMVGLPFIGTVGACAGKMVAIASPNGMPEKYNWARVLKHEFVHVVNLQQTHFNIPHWYTEALAVRHENMPRPTQWSEILARRAKADSLFRLDDINLGFIRPRAADDWTLAYCQAELYAEFMAKEFGEQALSQLLAAYADNLTTDLAIERCFKMKTAAFEKAYRGYIDQIVSDMSPIEKSTSTGLAELQKAVVQSPDDADAQANLANAFVRRGDFPAARKHALAARKIDKKHQLAAYVIARVYLSIGDAEIAVDALESAIDETDPQPDALALLAGLKLKAEQFAEARRLYEIGVERYPHSDRWIKSLARVDLRSGDQQQLAASLEKLVAVDYDNPLYAKKLAELAISAKDFDRAIHWSNQALHIDVMDADVHATLAETYHWQGKYDDAIREYEFAVRLSPRQLEWRFQLVEACIAADRREQAIDHLNDILKQTPNDQRAKDLRDELNAAEPTGADH